MVINSEVVKVETYLDGRKILYIKTNHGFHPNTNNLIDAGMPIPVDNQILKRRIKMGRICKHDVSSEVKILADYYGEADQR